MMSKLCVNWPVFRDLFILQEPTDIQTIFELSVIGIFNLSVTDCSETLK